ncbi:hypothetical protein PRIPAC_73290 [Pristionchus pacificus]|uniref:Uncharacterized protein n=1 Tax=Pristionchus pacificus TaxID=54126 RepID=A0A2A6BFP5_PRIPA|nr:hypothetical protein PRIPAC_73290 [Pristionchus pacificus]|eukprot:PDM64714.1 hypothetical protein PRIPAC_52970 [Pristionchus pacificus]
MSGLITLTHNGRVASIVPIIVQEVDNLVHEIPLVVKNDCRSELTVQITPNKAASIFASLSKEDQSFVLIGGTKRTVTIHMDTRYNTLKKVNRCTNLELNVKFENPPSAASILIFLMQEETGRSRLDTPFPRKYSRS